MCGGGIKNPCLEGTYAAMKRSTSCTSSLAGYHVPTTGASDQTVCLDGKYSQARASECFDCPSGFACRGGSRYPCLPGSYSPGGESECLPCPAGSVSLTSSSAACTLCTPGMYAHGNSTSCIDCEGGYYCQAGIKSLCSEGTFSTSKQSSCSTCPPGFTCDDNIAIPCTPGYYCNNGIKTTCSVGTYSLSEQSSCTVCGTGLYTSNRGSTSCLPCSDGYVCENGILKDCLPGTYCLNGEGIDCLAGSYSDGGVVTRCDSCKQGTYNPISGAKSKSDCSACPLNMITNTTGTSFSSDCGCDTGYYTIYSEDKVPTCKKCEKDLVCNGFNLTVSDALPATDYYVIAWNVTTVVTAPCPTGACNNSQCTANYEGFLCSKCRTGTYKEGSIQKEVHCTTCETPFLPGWNYFQGISSILIGWLVVAFQVYTRRKRMYALATSSSNSNPSSSPTSGKATNISTVNAILQSDSSKSIVMKLIVNYLQVITIVGNFKIQWSSSVRSMFGLSNILSSGGSLENAGFSLSGGLKCIMYRDDAPLPVSELIVSLELLIINGIVIVGFWFLYYAWMRRGEQVRRRNNRRDAIIVSLLVLCYNSYPKFIRGFFQLFSCTRFPGETNTSRLVGSLDTICYSRDHISWFLLIGLPVLLVIVIGFPLAGLLKLKNEYRRGALNDPSILSTVGFLYDGMIYKRDVCNL